MAKYGLKFNSDYMLKNAKVYSTNSFTEALKNARARLYYDGSANHYRGILRIEIVRLDDDDWCEGIVTYDNAPANGLGWVFIPYSGTEAYKLKADGTLADFTNPQKVKRAKRLVAREWE